MLHTICGINFSGCCGERGLGLDAGTIDLFEKKLMSVSGQSTNPASVASNGSDKQFRECRILIRVYWLTHSKYGKPQLKD
jgi:hypothetical protein